MNRIDVEELNRLDQRILDNWETAWTNRASATQPSNDFMDLVEENYIFFHWKASENKVKNFSLKEEVFKTMKKRVLQIGALVIGIYLLQVLLSSLKFLDMEIEFSAFAAVLVFLTALLAADCYVSIKRIGVHKYQESWARHSDALHRMQTEMVKYYETLPPYNGPDDLTVNRLFMLNILNVLDRNNEKFVDNMENKEVELNDLPDKLIFKSKE